MLASACNVSYLRLRQLLESWIIEVSQEVVFLLGRNVDKGRLEDVLGLPGAALPRLVASKAEQLVVLGQDYGVVATTGHPDHSLALELLDAGRLIDLLGSAMAELALVVLDGHVAPGV